MARRSRRRRATLEPIYSEVARQHGFTGRPQDLKFFLAQRLSIPFEPGYNGNLVSRDAGRIGGNIGGPMVREMIRRAETQLTGR